MNRFWALSLLALFSGSTQADALLGYWQDTADPNAWIEIRDRQLVEWLDGRRMSASEITVEPAVDSGSDAHRLRYTDEPSQMERLRIAPDSDGRLERQIGDNSSHYRRILSGMDLASSAKPRLLQAPAWKSGACRTVMTGFQFRASSTLPASSRADYEAIRLLDGRTDTAWVEGASNDGVDQLLTLDLSELRQQLPDSDAGLESIEAMVLDGLQLINGYPKSPRLYQANGRVAVLQLELDDTLIGTWKLADTDRPQALALQPSLLLTRDAQLRLRIAAVYPGERYADTALAELQPVVHGCAQILAVD